MTDEKATEYVMDRVGEVLSSFIVIGFRADNHTPFILTQLPDPQSAIAVNALLAGTLGQGGFAIDAEKDPQ